MRKTLFLLAVSFLIGCSSPPPSHLRIRYDGPPFEINDMVRLKSDHNKTWCVWEVKGDKVIGATNKTVRPGGGIFMGSTTEVVKEELSIYDLERRVEWLDDQPEPPKRK